MPSDFDTQIIEQFRTNGGHVGGPFEGMSLLLLHHTGARSGDPYINPLAYLEDDGRYVIFASKAGAPENPSWFHNLKANSDTSVEVGVQTRAVSAEEATGEERDRLYSAMAAKTPQFAEYEKQTERVIPVVVLTPAEPA